MSRPNDPDGYNGTPVGSRKDRRMLRFGNCIPKIDHFVEISWYYERARASGMDFYLLKPADPAVLLACLEPEKYSKIIAESVALVAASREMRQTSAAIIAQCHAVSLRCQEAVRRARGMREIIRARRRSEGRDLGE